MKHGCIMKSKHSLGGFSWPSISRLQDGRLAVVASGFRLAHVCPFGKVVISYSSDEGSTWSVPGEVLNTPLDDRDAGICVSGKLVVVTSFNNSLKFQRRLSLRDRTPKEQKLIEAYLDFVSEEEEKRYLGSTVCLSEDNGVTFQYQGHIPITSPHGPCVLSDGSFYYLGKEFCEMDEQDRFPINRLKWAKSKDGKIWEVGNEILMPDTNGGEILFCEPYAIQLPDNSILAALRAQDPNGLFTIYTAKSFDGGKTFGAWKNVGFHGSPPHFCLHSSGALILTYGYRIFPFGQRARISYNYGESWGEEIVLRDDGLNWDLGYPATCELKDGSLITVYYQREKEDLHTGIYYTIWKLPKK